MEARLPAAGCCRCDLHEQVVHWEASVNSRTSKRPAGCPVCGGLRAADQRRQPSAPFHRPCRSSTAARTPSLVMQGPCITSTPAVVAVSLFCGRARAE